MSAPEAAGAQTQGEPKNATDLALDVSRLHALPSEQQELYLLNFVSDLLLHVRNYDDESLPLHQPAVKKELIKIIGLSAPLPSRVISNSLGQIFADIFRRGSRSILYETINDLAGLVNAGKGERDLKTKQAAVVCLGQIFQTAGDSAVSLSSLVCISLIRLTKQSQAHVGVRGSIYKALALVARGVGRGLDEQIARDIWKQARNAASSDKAAHVQRWACYCLECLVTSTPYFDNSSDFDSFKSTVWKTIDSPIAAVRCAAGNALAVMLVKAHSETGSPEDVPTLRKAKRTTKKQTPDEDIEPERPGSPAPRKPVVQLSLSMRDACRVLSRQYCKPGTTNKSRAGIAFCYKQVMLGFSDKVVEEHYGVIADHLTAELLDHPTISYNRYRLLVARRHVKLILEDVVAGRVLNEAARLSAARWLINNIIKNYPQVLRERREPTKGTLTSALSALSHLIDCLGSAVGIMGDACREALLQVVQHPNYTVQIHVAYCLRIFVLKCPQQQSPCIAQCMRQLQKEIDLLPESRHPHRKCAAYANAAAAMLSTYRNQPLYGSLETFSKAFATATDLLKASSISDLRVSASQIQVAWILIGGLMPLGPNFVKVHLPQLLLLWRNALAKPLSRENAAKRGTLETSFLAHVRECALGALLVFLEYNSALLTLDSSKRLATMLQNCVLFLDSFTLQRHVEEIPDRLIPDLQLQDLTIMVRRRVLQCFSTLVSAGSLEISDLSTQPSLVSFAISCFTEAESAAPRTLETSIASSASNFESIWELEDNWGFGVTGLVRANEVELPGTDYARANFGFGPSQHVEESAFDYALRSPICHAREHDSTLLYHGEQGKLSLFDPPPTQVVNAAIELFGISFPLQPPKVQESSLEQIATIVAQPFAREPGRRAAILVNTTMALLTALMTANRETKYNRGKLAIQSIGKLFEEILRRSISESDCYIRNLGVEALGRLCSNSGSQFTNTEVTHLIETIVANRDPNIRAGCALALGSIHAQIGGMAAGFHVKNIVGVLLSLCNDPHPIVHFWALEGLRRVTDSAGLTFSAFVTGTLGVLAQLYASDSHNEEVASMATSNLEVEYPSPLVISLCIDSLINVLGPDLQDANKARALIITMVGYFQREYSPEMVAVAFTCTEHLWMYAPRHHDFIKYVRSLQKGLSSKDDGIRNTSIDGLSNIMKHNAEAVFEAARSGLEDELWMSLDLTPNHDRLQNIIRGWLQQTFLDRTTRWVERCQNILSKTRTKVEKAVQPVKVKSATVPDLQDEEAAGFAASAAAAQGDAPDTASEGQEFLKWQTRSFAVIILSELLTLVGGAMLPDQVIPAELALQSKVADIIRIAFSASTANVVELRTTGLRIIDQVLKLFGKTPDPDFLEASLLEQYQAQISSALTPAFAADSSPVLASEAMNVCATFVATGIVTSVERMGRIFKILVTGLENSTKISVEAQIGELKGLGSNGQIMLKMATLSAWAQLQISSTEQPYLVEIVQPYIAKLTPLWLSALQEFAKLRFEPEISSSAGGDVLAENLDEMYAAFNREIRLSFYQDAWLHLVDAIAILVDKDSDFVFDALDNKGDTEDKPQPNGAPSSERDISFREEPVAFFFILYGLAFEALIVSARDNASQTLSILQALKKILRPAVSGNAVYQDIVFTETMDVFGRLAMTGGIDLQPVLVDIARNLSLDHVSAKSNADRDENLSDDIDQLFELTRIIILILASLIPTLEEPPGSLSVIGDKAVALVLISLEALVDVAKIFPSVIRTDLYTCITHVFCTILATGACQADVIPQALPIFRRFLQYISSSEDPSTNLTRLIRGALSRILAILAQAQRRENEFALSCAKNSLLAITVLLTSTGRSLPANEPLVTRALTEMLDCLQDVGLGRVAVNCMRTLLLVTKKSPCEEAACRILFPRLLSLVSDPAIEDPENVRSSVAHALTSSVVTINKQGKVAAIAMIMPMLLLRAQEVGEELYGETAKRLLELAGADPAAFRSAVVMMDSDDRSFLEAILKSSGAAGSDNHEEQDVDDGRPTIELRMDF